MKANQKFMQADDAVSPVIGVILMVAITVVLAAVVFVLVSDLGSGAGDSQPNVSWGSVSQTGASSSVAQAEAGTNWNEYEIRFSAAGVFGINCNPQGAGACTDGTDSVNVTTAEVNTYVSIPNIAMNGGDDVYFCVDAAGPLTATLRHVDSNSEAKEFTFNSAPLCL